MYRKIVTICLIVACLGVEVLGSAGDAQTHMIAGLEGIVSPSAAVSQQDLSAYGVTAAPMSITEDNSDTFKGLKITLGSVSTRSCQSIGINDHTATAAAFFAAAGSDFVRMWVYNPDPQEIGICLQLTAGSKTAMLDPVNAVLTRSDGQNTTIKTEDLSGIGSKYHLVVPAGFAGWAAWPATSSALRQAWSYTLLTDIGDTSDLRLDIRPKSPGSSDHYVIDDICISSSRSGTTRSYTDPLVSGTAKTKQEILTMFTQYLDTIPGKTMLPDYDPDSHPDSATNEWSSIKALTYDGALFDGKKTKVFAYMGLPKGASASSKCPAVVLVHGGGGHAFAEWIKIWNDRGYAAIAMDNTGYFPSPEGKGKAGREADYYQAKPYWQYGLYGSFIQSGYANAPNNDFMNSSGASYDRQWMYHAVSQVILAHNILRNEPAVDTNKTGMVGISWGGVISSIVMGYDNRFAFAVPIYGTGHLDKGLTYMYDYFSPEPTKTLWSAADRFSFTEVPALWLCWANDPSFSIHSNSRSYMDTRANGSVLSVINNWSHGHSGGWLREEPYVFADSIVKGSAGLTKCLTEPGATRNFDFQIRKSSDALSVSAKAYYLTEEMTYSMDGLLSDVHKLPTIDQAWKTVRCQVSGNTVFGTLPRDAYCYYIEIDTDTNGGHFITSTRFVEKITSEGEPYDPSSQMSDTISTPISDSTSSLPPSEEASTDRSSDPSVADIDSGASSSETTISSSGADPSDIDDSSIPASSEVPDDKPGGKLGWLWAGLAVVAAAALTALGLKWNKWNKLRQR
ncbi:hypothetical protein EOM86_00920 [Candidatus Nomurabacteria bacterium]|nr:hypothetical protein [Candidatus Nomurabacteria bacterium]